MDMWLQNVDLLCDSFLICLVVEKTKEAKIKEGTLVQFSFYFFQVIKKMMSFHLTKMSFFFFGLLLTNLGDKILSKYLEED